MKNIILSIAFGIITFLILFLLKRNKENIFWVNYWFMSPLFPLCLFFFICLIFAKNNEKIAALILALLFLAFIIISLSEHNKITNNGELINSAFFRKDKVIKINEIASMSFTFTVDPTPDSVIEIKGSYKSITIKSSIENIEGFINQLIIINNGIEIIGNKNKSIVGIILLNILTFIMFAYCFYEILVYI